MVTKEQLKKLAEPIEYKYRLQSAKYGKATIVSYIDSRQAQDRFDEVCGIENWQNEYRAIDGSLFGGISILVDRGDEGEWITKWDVGSESSIEKEKGNSSDSFKRAAVMWGVGRFLYSLGIITLKAVKHTNDKEYPATDEGKILWNTEDLTEYCKKVVASGELDRTKAGVRPLNTTPQPTAKVTPTKATVPTNPTGKGLGAVGGETGTSALQPNTNFDKKADPAKDKALEMFNALDKPTVLKYLIKDAKMRYTKIEDFVEAEPIEKIREIYTALTVK